MTKPAKIITILMCSVVILAAALIYPLFHGYFDQGTFELLSSERSPSGQLAMVAKRSDHQAMNGDNIFVVLGDHIYTPAELRHALYSPAVVFSSDWNCLHLHWKSNRELEIACEVERMPKGDINFQLREWGGVSIAYTNIGTSF